MLASSVATTVAVFAVFAVLPVKSAARIAISPSVEDTVKINNLKRAWQFLLDKLDRSCDFDYLCRLNMIIGGDGSIFGAGKFRAYDVRITGTNWQPQIPFEYDIINEMADFFRIELPTERAITLMLWCMRRQIFIDTHRIIGCKSVDDKKRLWGYLYTQ